MRSFDLIQIKILLRLHNYLYRRISGLAKKINKGVHPKHQIMNYHKYFINNIKENSTILDIGCGKGNLTYDLSKNAKYILACDINKRSIISAKKFYASKNIDYINVDATNYNFDQIYDYVILSNVLEHIKERKDFLTKIKAHGKIFLFRVPMLNRSWLSSYKKKLGIEYRLDKSHYIEYTLESFKSELESVGLGLVTYSIQFGEIWAKVKSN